MKKPVLEFDSIYRLYLQLPVLWSIIVYILRRYDDVKEDDITYVDGKRFKLIHLMGAHVPFYYDKDVNEVDNANYYTCIESSMTVTMAYLDKLREAGVYDNSVIIVLSDQRNRQTTSYSIYKRIE